jgi:hypothetical protein
MWAFLTLPSCNQKWLVSLGLKLPPKSHKPY